MLCLLPELWWKVSHQLLQIFAIVCVSFNYIYLPESPRGGFRSFFTCPVFLRNQKSYSSPASFISFRNLTSCTASRGATIISHPGSFASRSPFRTATLPGMISFLDFTLPSMFSFTKVEMDVPENLPAAQDVSTESPPASLMIRFTGTPDLSSSRIR